MHGRHGVTGSIYLNEGIYYPMRILFGENGGGDNMTVYFHPPGDTWITNGYGWYYHILESKDITSDYIFNFNFVICFLSIPYFSQTYLRYSLPSLVEYSTSK